MGSLNTIPFGDHVHLLRQIQFQLGRKAHLMEMPSETQVYFGPLLSGQIIGLLGQIGISKIARSL